LCRLEIYFLVMRYKTELAMAQSRQRTDLPTELTWLSMDRFFSSVIPRTEIEISVASTETDGQLSDSATFMPLVAQTRQ